MEVFVWPRSTFPKILVNANNSSEGHVSEHKPLPYRRPYTPRRFGTIDLVVILVVVAGVSLLVISGCPLGYATHSCCDYRLVPFGTARICWVFAVTHDSRLLAFSHIYVDLWTNRCYQATCRDSHNPFARYLAKHPHSLVPPYCYSLACCRVSSLQCWSRIIERHFHFYQHGLEYDV